MTEKEAKTKWCPFVRAVVGADPRKTIAVVGNRFDSGEVLLQCKCIGSACMAWRCDESGEGPVHFYCGLAGHP